MLELASSNPLAYAVLLSIAALAGSFIAARVFYWVFRKTAKLFTRRTKTTLDDRLLEASKRPLELILIAACFIYAASLVSDLSFWAEALKHFSLAIFALLAGYLLSESTGAVFRWYYEEGSASSMVKLDVSLLPLLRMITKVLIYIIACSFALSFIGVDVTAILAIGSITGLVLGLASQETLANFFAGLALLTDRPYRYGDVLRFPTGETAILRRIGLRTATLEDLDHNTVVISNSELAKQRITNMCKPSHKTKISIPVSIAHGQDLDWVSSLITASISRARVPGRVKSEPVSAKVTAWTEGGVTLSASFLVDDFKSRGAAVDAAYRAVHSSFKKSRVRLP